ncbi:hypothetical protein AB2L27_00720 [Kineococcus sp. LSe6-4]|uniref:SAP domain-containing protein n=1 Tax=Kineococcus halophytocola TaxID=3234027 RepID=A0ABV4GXE9_9ACTN
MTTSTARYWTWGRRLEVVGYVGGVVAGVGLAVDNARERNWWWLVAAVLIVVVAGRELLLTLRRGSAAGHAAADRRRQEVQEVQEARSALTDDRLRALAEQHRLDVTTSSGKIALIRVLRAEDPRLTLVDAKTLVDGLQR